MGGDFTHFTPERRKEGLRELGTLPCYLLDHYGNLDLDRLFEAMEYAVRRLEIRLLVIDHLGFLVQSSDDERRAIEQAIRRFAVFAVQKSVSVVCICHPNNMSIAQQRRVMMGDLKGASAIRQDAHEVLVLERILPGKAIKYPAAAVHVDKCRSELGRQGAKVVLYYDPLACIYADEWEATPTGRSSGGMDGHA